ncbi:hypothetical protein TWF694_004386 [Orbilia ellipsospora]|uniref:Uncharacterized protein n=1 Tax=Orbilia ellipsospora TaxID=2528407 RepID=A0AAV9WV54_9PEZI
MQLYNQTIRSIHYTYFKIKTPTLLITFFLISVTRALPQPKLAAGNFFGNPPVNNVLLPGKDGNRSPDGVILGAKNDIILNGAKFVDNKIIVPGGAESDRLGEEGKRLGQQGKLLGQAA